jgi:hypothetical protein
VKVRCIWQVANKKAILAYFFCGVFVRFSAKVVQKHHTNLLKNLCHFFVKQLRGGGGGGSVVFFSSFVYRVFLPFFWNEESKKHHTKKHITWDETMANSCKVVEHKFA